MTVDEKYEREAERSVPPEWLEQEVREKPKKKAKVKKVKRP